MVNQISVLLNLCQKKMTKSSLILYCILCSCLHVLSQTETAGSLLFYNAENLFDTFDDSLTNDDEFTPWGDKHWTRERFSDKLSKIYKTIVSAGKGRLPDFVALCEIENRFCLQHLIDSTLLWKADYRIVHFDSPDQRGIDVALLYRSSLVDIIASKPIRLDFENKSEKSRDILYVYATIGSDSVHLFINHWPSKRGGAAKSEPRRIVAAKKLWSALDSVREEDPYAQIILCGDFNENNRSEAIVEYLHAGCEKIESGLHNLTCNARQVGTHKYRGRWDFLDQIIVSSSFVSKHPGKQFTVVESGFLLCPDFTWTGNKPFRTYQGPRYLGGYSDHLPVLLTW